jgi:predicted amidophosphoribosyltransferase
MSIVGARRLAARLDELQLGRCFSRSALLVPVPSSQVSKPATLWVPLLLARALVAEGLGRAYEPCLRRIETVPKSATSASKDRPTPQRHYESLAAGKLLFPPDEILLIDDVVTRGATLLGAASRLAEAFPGARITAFAAMRAISERDEFKRILDPCIGQIRLREDGSTLRRP